MKVLDVQFFEQPMVFTKPFRFGDFTLENCPQIFTQVIVQADGRISEGCAAELAVPRWFDKNPGRSAAHNVEDLRIALRAARDGYMAAGKTCSVFQLHGLVDRALPQQCPDLPPLVRSFGLAQIEKALIDAVCKVTGLSFAAASGRNMWGIDLHGFKDGASENIDASAALQALVPREHIALRHTVGFPTSSDPAQRDAELQSLVRVVAAQHLRYLKVKLSGSPQADAEWVAAVCAALGWGAMPRFSLDANEQYGDERALDDLFKRLARLTPLLAGALSSRCLFIEQPLPRESALNGTVNFRRLPLPFAIDESDDDDDAFLRAMRCGYQGVSSKACKGVIRSLTNIVRCASANRGRPGHYFVTPEDLCTQTGWALQQDLALAALTGSTHVEKNGHQYIRPFSGMDEQMTRAFLDQHPDLYSGPVASPSLRLEEGMVSLRSINMSRGFGLTITPSRLNACRI